MRLTEAISHSNERLGKLLAAAVLGVNGYAAVEFVEPQFLGVIVGYASVTSALYLIVKEGV